jgi:hypothetical protein
MTIEEHSHDTSHGYGNQQEKRDGQNHARDSSGYSLSAGDTPGNKSDSKREKC